MSFVHLKTIDGKELWLNLGQVTSISFSPGEEICLIEFSGGEPQQISLEEFEKVKPLLSKSHSSESKKRK